jgi:hypothetical protein
MPKSFTAHMDHFRAGADRTEPDDGNGGGFYDCRVANLPCEFCLSRVNALGRNKDCYKEYDIK